MNPTLPLLTALLLAPLGGLHAAEPFLGKQDLFVVGDSPAQPTQPAFHQAWSVPTGTNLHVRIPSEQPGLAKARGVKFLRMDGDRAVLEVEEGSYRFGSGTGRLR